MPSSFRPMSNSNRNLRPAYVARFELVPTLTNSNAPGSAGTGAHTLPLLFNPNYNHDEQNPNPPLALARVGGQGGSIFIYADEPDVGLSQGGCTSFAGGGRQWF